MMRMCEFYLQTKEKQKNKMQSQVNLQLENKNVFFRFTLNVCA